MLAGPASEGHAGTMQRRFSRVFVGREHELLELLDAIDEALGGAGAIFLVSGAAGIGKTRLGEEVAARAARRGARVLWGRSSDDPGSPPFWPWTQILRGLEPQAADPLTDFAPASDLSRLDDAARFRLFDLVTAALLTHATSQPLVLVLDDLQFADVGSLRLLEFVARVVPDEPVLILGLVREAETPVRSERTERLVAVGRSARSIPLRGLSRPELETFVRDGFGLEPPDEVMASLWRLTEGNPFFADEIVRLFSSEQHIAPAVGDLAVPQGVRDVIRRRLEPLADETRAFLRIASAAGLVFRSEIVGRAADLDDRHVTRALAEAGEHRVIEPSDDDVSFSFSHALMREALAEELGPDERARVHLALAGAIEELRPDHGREDSGRLAHHYLQARALVGARVVIERLVRAGEVALSLLAHEEAAGHFEKALAVLETDPSGDDRMRAALLASLGECRSRAGAFFAAMDAFDASTSAARTAGAHDVFVRSAVGLEDARFRAGDFTHLLTSLQLLDEALELTTDDAARADVLSRRPLALQFASAPAGPMIEAASEAVAIAERLGDERLLIRALDGQRAAHWRPEDAAVRARTTHRLLAVAKEVRDPDAMLRGTIYRFCDDLATGRPDRLDGDLLAVETAAADTRVPWLEWWPPAMRGTLALMRGDFAAALRHAADVSRAVPDRGDQLGQGAAALITALYAWELGEGARVRSSLDTMVELIPVRPIRNVFNAFADVACGRETDAARAFEEIATGGFGPLVHGPTKRLSMIAMLASVCARLGDADRADELYASLISVRPTVVVIMPLPAMLTTPHWLGVLAATSGRTEDACAHFTDAIRWHERLGAPAWVARTKLELGKALVAADAADGEAIELLDGAAELASTLAQRAVADEATAVGERTRRGAGGNVFCREGDVWQLAFAGRTVRLADVKGLRYIAALLARPSEEVHVLRLPALAAGGGVADTDRGAQARLRPDAGARDATIDDEGVASYRRRLAELERDADDAEAAGDDVRLARAREESEWIARELSRALGLHGRDRRPGTPAERARVNVQRAIRTAVDRIAAVHPALAAHLTDTVRTGTFCVYLAGASAPRWTV